MSREQIEIDRIQQERDEIAQTIADNFGYSDIDKYDASDFEWVAYQVQNKGYRKQEWISVEERLPEETCECLIVDTLGVIFFAPYSSRYRAFNATDEDDGDRWRFNNITHWMPLPMPPKGEKV